jgi:predicted AAA+ superfamily ATPase
VPSVIFIAGPNGAGKTTFSDEYLSAEERKIEFVNADEMARGLEYRRFEKSLLYFETIYKPIVDEWYIWESREGAFVLVDAWNRN